jgi:hypothetical protein
MANSASFQKDSQGSFLSLLPLVKAKTGEFLIKSADLKREINQEEPPLSSSMVIEKDAMPTFSSLFSNIDEKQFCNSRSFAN